MTILVVRSFVRSSVRFSLSFSTRSTPSHFSACFFSCFFFPFTTVQWSNTKSVRAQLSVFEAVWIDMFFILEKLFYRISSLFEEIEPFLIVTKWNPTTQPSLPFDSNIANVRSPAGTFVNVIEPIWSVWCATHLPSVGRHSLSLSLRGLHRAFSDAQLGYNFDQITCESCKAFFRRNALNNLVKIGEESVLRTVSFRF